MQTDNTNALIDISIPIEPGLAGWPGDSTFHLDWTLKKSDGMSVNVGAIKMSTHFGTHIDAPFHFSNEEATVEAIPLSHYIGPAYVVNVGLQARIAISSLSTLEPNVSRVLIRTDAWTDHKVFPVAIPVIEPDVPKWLYDRGVVLLGIDLPSVDSLDSKELPNHHELAKYRISILESLDLRHVAPGPYFLHALPLHLVGADASPVRAVLARLI